MNTTKPIIFCLALCQVFLPAKAQENAQPGNGSETVLEKANNKTDAPKVEPAEPAKPTDPQTGEKGLRLNFRGVPLEMVLDYLSDAAGFIIVLETPVSGKVDVWSNQPLSKDEAVALLNNVLNKNGYAAIRDGRTLTILSREEAKKRNVPVHAGSDPDKITPTDEIVTQVIPIRYINAVQLIKDLQPLLPEKSTITANEGGNAVLITDTKANVHRLAQIVKALDTAVASISTVKVFPLKYADAKALATVIEEVFQSPDSSANTARQIINRFRGGGPPGFPFPGGGGGDNNAPNNQGRAGASRVTAVADERTNSLVVGAPDELIPTIEEVVNAVDTNVEDVTELRVFRLKHSDPVEIADLLTELFPDTSTTDQNRAGVRFGGGPFGPFGFGGGPGGGRGNQNQQSERSKKQGKVIAAPDARTRSVVVSASKDLMEQIAGMISQLDADPSRKQKVFVYSLENADVQNVEEILRGLFETQNTRSTLNTRQNNNNPLNNRNTGNQNNAVGSGFGNNNAFGGGGNQR